MTTLTKLEAALDETHTPPPPSASDDPVVVAQRRADDLVTALSSFGLTQLREQMDSTASLIASLEASDKLLKRAIDEHGQRVASVVASKVIMNEQLTTLRELFQPQISVLTQLNGTRKS